MDSFYVFSRPPAPRPNHAKDFSPAVPDISLIFDKKQEAFDRVNSKGVRFEPPVNGPAGPSNAFQQIYMANIPNGKLDLSLIEAQKTDKPIDNPCERQCLPTTYKEFLNTQKDAIKTREVCEYKKYQSKRDADVQTSFHNREIQTVDPAEPTVRDLMKIIEQQNQQMLILQKQVATLLERDSRRETNFRKPHKSPLSKFAIDMTTSFEVSFRPQRRVLEPKIREITECDNTSMVFQEPIELKESCPSPEPSIDIQMQDFDETEDNSTEVEMTFYKNLMEHINGVITNESRTDSNEKNNAKINQRVLEEIMKQLKNIGVDVDIERNLNNLELRKDTESNNDLNFVVKQLLMKYLPSDFLSEAARKVAIKKELFAKEKVKSNPKAPQFSFASVQFMKKYNLMSKAGVEQNKSDFKILSNIAQLKKQPKLI